MPQKTTTPLTLLAKASDERLSKPAAKELMDAAENLLTQLEQFVSDASGYIEAEGSDTAEARDNLAASADDLRAELLAFGLALPD